jgi:serine/threonine protein kinase
MARCHRATGPSALMTAMAASHAELTVVVNVVSHGRAAAADVRHCRAAIAPRSRSAGSPQFISPEQVRGGAVTSAADVFALGALAAYAATGRPPFGKGDGMVVLYRVLPPMSIRTALRAGRSAVTAMTCAPGIVCAW